MGSDAFIENLQIQVDRSGYKSLGFQKPNRIRTCGGSVLADTRAQVMMIGPDLAMKLRIRREDMMGSSMDIKETSGGSLEVLGGIPVILSLNPNDNGNFKKTHQLAYVILGVTQIVVNRSALCELDL